MKQLGRNPEIFYIGIWCCQKLKYRVSFEKRPIYVRKLLNNTKLGVEWRCLRLRYGGDLANASYIWTQNNIWYYIWHWMKELDCNPEICYLAPCWCLWLRYINGFGNVPYFRQESGNFLYRQQKLKYRGSFGKASYFWTQTSK